MDHIEQGAVGVDDEGDPLVGQEARSPLRPQLGGHGAVGVGEQREAQRLLLVELLLLVHRVGADADPLRPDGGELGPHVAEVTALLGAAVGHGGWIEEEHHRAAEQQLAQLAGRARLVGQLEVGHDVTFAHAHNVGRNAGPCRVRLRSGNRRPAR